MKPYKRLFNESNHLDLNVDSEREAKQLVKIDHLEWYSFSKDDKILSYSEAIDRCPFGWRLPTVQELYSAYVKLNEHFVGLPVMTTDFVQDYYWSASVSPRDFNYAWYFDFLMGNADSYNKQNKNYVKYVKGKAL